MVDYRPQSRTNVLSGSDVSVHEGLRSHMLKVYNYMSAGLGLTALVAFAFFNLISDDGRTLNQFGSTLFNTPLKYVVMFAPFAMVMFLSFGINRLSASAAQLSFWAYAALMGVSLSTIGLAFAHSTIASAFLVTSVTFGAMSLWGYTTKRDLTAMGSFAMMAVIGLVIASIVNIFLQSSMMQFIISCISVIAFTLLTAYDTQKIRDLYFEVSQSPEGLAKASIMGALSLYLDFINIFLSVLQLMRGSNE